MANGAVAIETQGLTLNFGKLTAVSNLNLCVPVGSVYGFLGLNGAGKTSTIRMLLGLIQPYTGEIRLFGQPFSRTHRKQLNQIGALVETPSLYGHLTGYENLELTRILVGAASAQIDRVLTIVGLVNDSHRLVRQYSLGMRQRLALAIALLNDPQLVILDEPTNGLDPAGIREIRALIGNLSAEHGITVFLSSHLLSEIEQVATVIGIIHKGKLLFQGVPDELHARLQEYVSIEVDQPDKARRILAQQGWPVVQPDEHRLSVLTNRRDDVAALTAQLVGAGLLIYHVSLQQPSLEDIFLKLTNEAVLVDSLENVADEKRSS
jgi:ABC-2 type transport system ATP-binding protein